MRDDYTIPNMGEAPANYDKGHINRVVRNVEMTFRTAKSKGPITATDLTAESGFIKTLRAYLVRVEREGSENAQYIEFGLSGVSGHVIRGYSPTNNAKSIIYDATTDVANTAPSSGENSHSFQIRGVEKFRVDDSSNLSHFRTTLEVHSAAGVRLFQVPQDTNGAIEIGKVDGNTSTPLIDFHTSATPTDYNVRIIASGTSSTNGSGQLDVHAAGGLNLIFGRLGFPATQQASTDPNTLDDYEEGTWAPALNFSGGSTGITYNTQAGHYVKIGQLVFYQGRIILSNKGSSVGNARISGLPFTVNSIAHGYTPGSVGYATGFTVTGSLAHYAELSNTYLNLMQSSAVGFAFLSNAEYTNASDIIFAGCYRASA